MLDAICDILKFAYKRNWISTRDGNVSYRRYSQDSGNDYFYVTPSGVKKQHLNSEMIIKLTLPDLQRVDDESTGGHQKKISGLNPTGELHLHYLLQKKIPGNRVVLHLHPTYIIAAMYAGLDLQKLSIEFPEINRYTKVGPNVPVVAPISKELAEKSVEALGLDEESGEVKYDIIGLDRHGIISVDKDAWSAFQHCERLEHICQIVLASGNFKNLMRD
jgi:ribulose-5-phosphate 4-epimerase/fuculose-1-phosphate aldolase